MKVKELLEKLIGKEDYEISINDDIDFDIEIDDDLESVDITVDLDDHMLNNSWRYSDYESKDIEDWDVDDHLANWFDHQMEK